MCRIAAGRDLNAWMITEGWAFAYRRYSLDYVAEEARARAAKRGVRQGEVVAPWEWRKGVRLGSTRSTTRQESGRCHQGQHRQERHAHLPCAGRAVLRPDANQYVEGGTVVLHRGRGAGSGLAAFTTITPALRRTVQ